ncbi:MAG: hypothetical protein U9O55_02685 [Patescibacteria group bacterium]|nr:hypothetical protein [Patescibacteria group bacterium]
MKLNCKNCNSKRFWKLNDNRFKCKKCFLKFSPNKNKIKISNKLLKQIISEFVLEHSTNTILDRINISKYKLLKILTLLRIEMTKDVPKIFEGIVEVDETYLGGQWKNKRLGIKKKAILQGKINKRGLGIIKQPAFGILCKNGTVWAEIVS